ncbi:hypothetical protein CC80DRAFT_496906 [Byssothecium circinans]|uniref:BTB domain-containing protein n=1 Tax=Byssothecium circinans TaxID=147558 RepID=A0A6A5TDI6_9PLEO|nr:hypothetical protein CC80DRAFT_496906 [Byssothecium circinans]
MVEGEPPAKRVKLSELPRISGEAVAVNVGIAPGQKTFNIHKSVVGSSRFLRAALRPEWAGEGPRSIDLSDEEPEIFGIYAKWLYSKRVLFRSEESPRHQAWSNLAGAYVLGEKLMDSSFQNDIVDAFAGYFTSATLSYGAVKIIYRGTAANSPMRGLLVDYWLLEARETWAKEDLVKWTSAEFVTDVLRALLRDRPHVRDHHVPWTEKVEQYYVKYGEAEE